MSETLLLRVEEAAEELRLSRAKVASMIATGELGSIKIGRSRRISMNQLERWIGEQERQGRAVDAV